MKTVSTFWGEDQVHSKGKAIGSSLDDEIGVVGPLAEIEFAIPKMHCGGCTEKIMTALQAIQGVREIKTKVAQMRVYVQYEPSKIQEDELKHLLDRAGFAAVAV